MTNPTERIRRAAVAGAFYPADPRELRAMIDRQLDHARTLLKSLPVHALPQGAPKAVIVPHAGYVYSGTTAALAYALLERGRGTIRRAVIVGPTHRVAVRGVAMCRATAFATPLGTVSIDVTSEARALGLSAAETEPSAWRNDMRATDDSPAPALLVNEPTHAREHAVEVQIPFLQTVLGPDLQIVPLNAGDASPAEVGDVLRALWGGPETVIVISSDLSHYHPNEVARAFDDRTIDRIVALDEPIHPNYACGAYPVNGLLDVCRRGVHTAVGQSVSTSAQAPSSPSFNLDLRFLGCCTSGDDGEVALSHALLNPSDTAVLARRPVPLDPNEPVVGYASFAVWQTVSDTGTSSASQSSSHSLNHVINSATAGAHGSGIANDDDSASRADSSDHADSDNAGSGTGRTDNADRARTAIALARLSLRRYLGIEDPDDVDPQTIVDEHDWLREPGASFVTLTEGGRLRGCIGTLEAYRPLGRDIADHAIDAASRDPRFRPITASEYPLLDVEVSVLGKPEPMRATSRDELESELRPGEDGLIINDGRGHRATFLPQVWDDLPDPHDFVSHLLAKSGLPSTTTWTGSRIQCHRYSVTAYKE
ncbi:AmmeMemoRadiSam system protein B [Bifidobacterium callimiconis]|uniref:AmmeMemoRadiSam system protein B n=1 Tax=Bifidobacterium callimiconis TaxID=2306973 RepID=A0A430F887_9BIFI|nr:AmmeMemoRadiSam system protein B [Bifidobacterium callimiconis]RSX49011.1 AmmeMemoRadiSam system protein B [Bifidobacterium callimiconis]